MSNSGIDGTEQPQPCVECDYEDIGPVLVCIYCGAEKSLTSKPMRTVSAPQLTSTASGAKRKRSMEPVQNNEVDSYDAAAAIVVSLDDSLTSAHEFAGHYAAPTAVDVSYSHNRSFYGSDSPVLDDDDDEPDVLSRLLAAGAAATAEDGAVSDPDEDVINVDDDDDDEVAIVPTQIESRRTELRLQAEARRLGVRVDQEHSFTGDAAGGLSLTFDDEADFEQQPAADVGRGRDDGEEEQADGAGAGSGEVVDLDAVSDKEEEKEEVGERAALLHPAARPSGSGPPAAVRSSSASDAAVPVFPDPRLPYFVPTHVLKARHYSGLETVHVNFYAQFRGACQPVDKGGHAGRAGAPSHGHAVSADARSRVREKRRDERAAQAKAAQARAERGRQRKTDAAAATDNRGNASVWHNARLQAAGTGLAAAATAYVPQEGLAHSSAASGRPQHEAVNKAPVQRSSGIRALPHPQPRPVISSGQRIESPTFEDDAIHSGW